MRCPHSPLRAVQSQFTSLEEAEHDAIQVYHGSLTRRTLVSVLIVLFFISIMGTAPLTYAGPQRRVVQAAGVAILCICAAVLAFVDYEYRRKQHVFILEDAFAVERRFRFDVELVRLTDVAKLYCIDRTTETKVYVYFVPWSASKLHRAKLRIVLVDGREIVLTNRVRDFSAMAAAIRDSTMAAVIGPLDRLLDRRRHARLRPVWHFERGPDLQTQAARLERYRPHLVEPPRHLVVQNGKAVVVTPINTDKLPNVALLLELLSKFGGEVYEE